MKSNYSSFEEFKDHSASIARGLNNTKISVLREAMVQAMGFKNVSAYKASFESAKGGTSKMSDFLDPNIYFYVEGDLLWFQGRIDFDDQEMTDPETGRMDVEWLNLDAPININPDVWHSMSEAQREQWADSVSSVWFGDSDVMVHHPLSLDGGNYARASFPIENAPGKSVAELLVSSFLISQRRMSRSLLLGHIFTTVLHELLLHQGVNQRVMVDVFDAARRMKKANHGRFDLNLMKRDDREPVLAFEEVLLCVKQVIGVVLDSNQSDTGALSFLKSCVTEDILDQAHYCADTNKKVDEWTWSQKEVRMVEKVFDWGLEAAEIGLTRALVELPKADLADIDGDGQLDRAIGDMDRDIKEALESGRAMHYTALYFSLGVPSDAEMGYLARY